MSGPGRTRCLLDVPELARPLSILERAAAAKAFVVIPLLAVALADTADVAAPIEQRLIARRADELRGRGRRRGGRVPVVAARQELAPLRRRSFEYLSRLGELPGQLQPHDVAALAQLARVFGESPDFPQQYFRQTRLEQHDIGAGRPRLFDIRCLTAAGDDHDRD